MAFQLFTLPLISIHALREEGDNRKYRRFCPPRWISIHALREEGDGSCVRRILFICPISIHALREEGDDGQLVQKNVFLDFYPRPPRGGRHISGGVDVPAGIFLSTPSARRATTCNP